MCCHLAGPPERLALDPKLHQGLRRKNQPGLVCSSTDYKGLGGFFYLPLWYGPNHGCQFSPLLLGSPSAFIFFLFLLTPPVCQTSAFFSFVFHFHLMVAFHVYIYIWHLLFLFPFWYLTKSTESCSLLFIFRDIILLEINNFPEYNISYVGVNPCSILYLFLGSEITKVNYILPFLGFNWRDSSGTKWSTENL